MLYPAVSIVVCGGTFVTTDKETEWEYRRGVSKGSIEKELESNFGKSLREK